MRRLANILGIAMLAAPLAHAASGKEVGEIGVD